LAVVFSHHDGLVKPQPAKVDAKVSAFSVMRSWNSLQKKHPSTNATNRNPKEPKPFCDRSVRDNRILRSEMTVVTKRKPNISRRRFNKNQRVVVLPTPK
jgi:hypothetical protein